MTVSSFTLRISGNAALEDGNIVSFLQNWDSNVLGELPDSNLSFRNLYPSKKSEVEALYPYVTTDGGAVSVSDPSPDAEVPVTSLSMVISGNIAYADDTVESVEFEVRDDGSVFNHSGGEKWDKFTNDIRDNGLTSLEETVESIFTTLYSAEGDSITASLTF